MKVIEWLKFAIALLEAARVSSARLDALILLEDATAQDRAWLLSHPDYDLLDFLGSDPRQIKMLEKQLGRRVGHEPLAYIRGKSEFYGREFLVTPATLQPRPETETMIELLRSLVDSKQYIVDSLVDVGTGSGCLAITAKLEWPGLEVHATELNKEALNVAKKNAQKLGANIHFYQGSLLVPLFSPQSSVFNPSIILANLPYVPEGHTINQAAMQEPAIAIFGGEDGLDLYRQLFKQLEQVPQKPRYALTESLPFQHQDLSKIAEKSGYKLQETENFIQVFHLIEACP